MRRSRTVKCAPKACRAGIYSGYPKMDYFCSDGSSTYEWKEAQPNSTNKFFYEYARDHFETSWVVKPHPNLLFSAVKEKVFPTLEAFQKYLDQ